MEDVEQQLEQLQNDEHEQACSGRSNGMEGQTLLAASAGLHSITTCHPGYVSAQYGNDPSSAPEHDANITHFATLLGSLPADIADAPWLGRLLTWLVAQSPSALSERGAIVPAQLAREGGSGYGAGMMCGYGAAMLAHQAHRCNARMRAIKHSHPALLQLALLQASKRGRANASEWGARSRP